MGRIYAAIVKEEVQDAVVITRSLLIHISPATILFDYDSLHTFIVMTFVDRIDVSV